MARLIDADALKEKLTMVTKSYKPNAIMERAAILLEDVETAPTIDAEPVVRCCDCKYLQCNMRQDGILPFGVDEYECRHWCGSCDPTDFCSYGERREDVKVN